MKRERLGGDIVVKQEPGQPPKLSRSSSQKVAARPPQLFSHLPDSTADALATFEQIDTCWYANKYMGYTEHAMECDCAEEWGMYSFLFALFTLLVLHYLPCCDVAIRSCEGRWLPSCGYLRKAFLGWCIAEGIPINLLFSLENVECSTRVSPHFLFHRRSPMFQFLFLQTPKPVKIQHVVKTQTASIAQPRSSAWVTAGADPTVEINGFRRNNIRPSPSSKPRRKGLDCGQRLIWIRTSSSSSMLVKLWAKPNSGVG